MPPLTPRRRIRKLRLLVLASFLVAVAIAAFSFGLVLAVGEQLSGLDPSHQKRLQVDGYVYASNGHSILAILRGSQSRILDSGPQISPWLKQAIVAVEDKRFWQRRGLDLRSLLRAVWVDLRHGGGVQGGSTITQQFVKNALTGSQHSIVRKLKEAALAWQIDQRWSKDRILTDYLNTIYFGNGAYGAERAARTYFGVHASQLTLSEAALLAGIPEDPTLYDPVRHPAAARARRTLVLELMLQQGLIQRSQYRRAVREPLPKPENVRLPGVTGAAPYFGEYVKEQLVSRFGARRVYGGGLRVVTTINLALQKLAQQAVQKWLPSAAGPQASLVAIDPQTGAVLAMVGGRDFHHSQFNLAVQGDRQSGSSFKPFVLATALKEGIAPETTYKSGPVSIFIGNKFWHVHNFEDEDLGVIDLTKAIAVSDNTVFAQLTRDVGPVNVVRTAHEMGITRPLSGVFSIGLGTQAVSPLDMARAYGTFADGGYRIDSSIFGDSARVVQSISNASTGKIVAVDRPVRREELSPDLDALLNQLLEGVVTGGTGQAAAIPGRVVAGKTGTTENYGDAWFVGYTPQLVTAVWVGYPQGLVPMTTQFHGSPVVGGTYPALIWKTFTQSALDALRAPPESFASPPYLPVAYRSVVYRNGQLELADGTCPDERSMVYFADRAPTHTADCVSGSSG
ncbi:MAG TPA: PBP1A family penicillin-binding protein [Gaiellaceae bacterium]|nr:PBP1A family penicillin-binding protein [Gaiellaceae bacterium]